MTDRDWDLIDCLCRRVRLFSLDQVACAWWSADARNARRARARLRSLAEKSWVRLASVLARPLLELAEPVFVWVPGAPGPDAAEVSRRLRRRWKAPVGSTDVVLAAAKAMAIHGGKFRASPVNPCQSTHDLHVAELFLRYRQNDPDRANHWLGEDALPRSFNFGKRPDVAIKGASGEIVEIVEFGGAYQSKRVRAFHAEWSPLCIPYSLW